MAIALYRTTLTQHSDYRPVLEQQAAADFQGLARDPEFGAYNKGKNELEIYVEWGDFAAKYPSLAILARYKDSSNRGAALFEKDAATPALLRHRADMLEQSRSELRNIPVPPTGPNDPANQTGITPHMDAATGRRTIMQNSGGFCQGRDHGQAEPLEALTQGLDDGSLLNGGGLLFIEELPAALQDMVDAWLADATATEMPAPLKTAMDAQDVRCNPKTPFKDLLKKAKEKGIKVFGIDGGDANPGVEKVHGGQPERRDVKMNALAKKVIDKARKKYPLLPMIASVGEAHVNHHEGGIPGIAQIMGVPGVITDPAGKLVPQPDDPTKRGMPSKAVQAFIDGYIDSLEANITDSMRNALSEAQKEAFKSDIYKNAKALADKLVTAGTVTDETTAREALTLEAVKDQRDEYVTLVKNWPKKATDPDGVGRDAIRAGSTEFLDKVLADHPTTLNKKDGDGRTLMHWAAMLGRPEMIDDLAGKGERVDAVDKDGNQPLQAAVKRRRDKPDPRVGFQGDTVGALVRNNADVNATGEGGRTAMHWAALNNNTSVLGALGNNARTDIPDARGWTAYDTAVGSTKVEAEQWFYTKGQANQPGVDQNSPALDTIQALMKSIKCENPGKHQQKIEDALKELYGNPDLRPALDLLAKNSLLPRDANGGGGVKIFIADRDNVGMLYNSVSGKGPAGAYDENAHVVHVAGEGPRDLAGELAHELTHAATRIAFDDKSDVPFKTQEQKKEFLAAIDEDVRMMSLIMKGNPREENIKEVISERMKTTVRDYPDEAENKLMQEFAVSVPQLIAEYGSDEVAKLAPGLMKFYRGTFVNACKTAGNDPKYIQINTKLDNTSLANTATPRTPAKPTWVATGKDTAGIAADMIRTSYKVFNGAPQNLPKGVTTPYTTDNYGLSMQQEMSFEITMQRVEKTLRKAMKEEGWPPEISAEAIRGLALEVGQEIKSGKPIKNLDEAVHARVITWARQSKIDYVEHCQIEETPVSDQSLAEATIIQAENFAWVDGLPPDGKTYLGVEVDKGKHKAMITDLAKTLGRPSSANAKQNPTNLVDTLSKAMVGDKNKGFYRKRDKTGLPVTEHVSISKKDAKQTWLANL